MTAPVLQREPPAGARPSFQEMSSRAVAAVARDWWPTGWFVLGLVAGSRALSDNSFLTHLATGRLILDGRVPHADPYTFTSAGQPWVVQSWLYSVSVAALERLAGAWSIRLAVGVVVGALVSLLWRLARDADSLVGRVAVTSGAVVIGLDAWNERPQSVAVLLVALTMLVLLEQRSVWWLAPVFGLWVNLHGSWPVGLIVVGGLSLRALIDRRRLDWSVVSAPVVAASSVVCGALLSPYGWSLVRFPLTLLSRGDVLQYLVEWRRPQLGDVATVALILQVALAVWAVWRRRAWGWVPLVVVMLALAVSARRNLPLASLVLVPVAASAWRQPGALRGALAPPRRTVAAVVLAAIVMLGVIVGTAPSAYDLGPYPVAAVEWLQSRNLVGTALDGKVTPAEGRIAHPDYVGNFLEWRFGSAAGAYLDDRAELASEALMAGYAQVLLGGRGDWKRILERDAIDVVVWPEGEFLADRLSASTQWRVAHRSRDGSGVDWLVFCRRESVVASRCGI